MQIEMVSMTKSISKENFADIKISIKNALTKLNLNKNKTLIIVDKNNKFKGTLAEGDIRRAIIKNAKLDGSIAKFYNKKPFILSSENINEKIKNKIINEKYDLVPIVKNKKVINVLFQSDFLNKDMIKNKYKDKKFPVIVMAGGKGTRLLPFTSILPKPLIPINNIPMIEHVMKKLIDYNFKNFFITINYKSELLKAYLKSKKFNNVKLISEKKPLGTAGGLSLLKKTIKTDFIVINADNIIDIDYDELIQFHKTKNLDLTIVATTKQIQVPYGICKLNKKGSFLNIVEKPKIDFLSNSGLYVCNKKILRLIKNDTYLDFNNLIMLCKKKGLKIKVYPISETMWQDLGRLNKINNFIKKNKTL
jgi:dTDP-glucose pyrophosphorylase